MLEVKNLNITDLKKISEVCGYMNDSIIFWHKCGKFGNRWRLVSTEVEALAIEKYIPKDRVVELYFEHLDSYIDMNSVNFQAQTTILLNQEDTTSHENTFSYEEFEDSENELSDDDMAFDQVRQKKHNFEDRGELLSDEVMRKMSNQDGESDCVDYDDQRSLANDSDNESVDFPKHNPITDAKNPVLALGYTFGSKKEFKYAVETHEVKYGRNIKWEKNDKIRIKAKCADPDCKWMILASVMHRDMTFQVKTYESEHTCKNWHHCNKTITSSFIAQTYLDDINKHRKWKLSEFRDMVSVGLKAHVSLDQARRAIKKALALLDGDVKEHFAMMWDYSLEIGRSNPRTSMYMKLTPNEMPNKPYRFQRIYVCFAACKEGFKAGCRKIVGVDGCWLKGQMYGFQLLTAVGLDANNNIFLVAHAVVERETRETWSWFLTHLVKDLEIYDEDGWTFMSDKQKGLIEAFNEVLPFVSHRFCVRHLHNNFKRAGFCGFSLKNKLWAAASATTKQFFEARMEELAILDTQAAAWLTGKTPSEWSRSHFSPDAKCDILLNNLCECFNSMILDAREKPIITLLEKIRYLLMARFQANRDKADRWNELDICPRIKNIVRKNEKAAAQFIPKKSNEWNYEILGGSVNDIWAVDLAARTCSCRRWTISGIPCKHAISAIWDKNDEVINYVDDCYKVSTYKKIYAPAILPINGTKLWPKSNKVPPLPPRFPKQKPGKKQKLRRKEQDEVGSSRQKMRKKQIYVDCSQCYKPGHNKRTCKFNIVEAEERVHEPACWAPPPSFVPEKLPVRRAEVFQGDNITSSDMGV